MAQAAVPDLHCRLGDITFAGAKQISGAFHPDLAGVLLNRHARFLGKKPAQVKGTAADQFPEFFERWRFAHALAENGLRALDTVARGPLLAGAK